MDDLIVLQSGFVAVGDIQLAKPDPFIDRNPRAGLYGTDPQEWTEAFYSPEVTKMYFEMVKDRSALGDFTFRENIIRLAFEGFRKDYFGEWVDVQKTFGHIEQSHIDFLVDCARFTAGIERRLHPVTWLSMINRSGKTAHLHFDMTKGLEPGQATQIVNQSAAMCDMVTRWVTAPNGYADLLTSLMVVYGSRDPKMGSYVG